MQPAAELEQLMVRYQQGDAAGIAELIQRLSPRSREMAADPWWSYRLCAGRDVDALMNALWSGVRMGDP